MKALILAAGVGSRLAPLTDHLPKCLVEVNGTPILMKQIENLVDMFADDASVDVSQYTSLIELVIVLAIIGLIVGIVRTYTKGEAD